MTTTVHLLSDNNETKVVSSLKMAYSSEGVSTLNVDSNVEFLKPLRSMLQSDKVQEADIWPCLLTKGSVFLKECLFQCADTVALPLPLFYGCDRYTV